MKNAPTLFVLRLPKCILSIWALLALQFYATAQGETYKKKRTNKRIYIGTLAAFYSNNPDHTIDTKGKTSFNFGFKRTFNIFTTNIDVGLEYVNQGFSFNSYYFAPGYSKLYDKTFPFTHNIRMNELQVPILLKQPLGKESKNKVSSYLALGWAWRIIMYSRTSIASTNDGIQVYDGLTDINFKYPFPWKHFGSLLQAGLGLQFNNLHTHTALFFETYYKLSISPYIYTGNVNTNNLLIKDSNISINVGYKF